MPFFLIVLILLSSIISLVCIDFSKSYQIDWKQAPAWTQAVGSLLAVLAAIWVSERDRRINLKSKKESNLAVIESVNECVNDFKQVLNSIDKTSTLEYFQILTSSLQAEIFSKEMLEGMLHRLNTLPINEIGLSPNGIRAYFKLCHHFSIFILQAQKFINGPDRCPEFKKNTAEYEDTKKRQTARETQYSILKNNTLQQLNLIEGFYKKILA